MTTTNLNSIVFPHETLTTIKIDPTFMSISQLKRELMANARTVPSTHWGGTSGHLGLCLSVQDYQTKTGHVFAPLIHPGPLPVHITGVGGLTGPQITAADREYDRQLADYKMYVSTESRLRNQIIAAVEPTYIQELQHFEDGFAGVSILDMLTHLLDNYGEITPQAKAANRSSLLDAWSPDQPLASLWIRLNEIREFAAAAEEPILEQTIMEQTIELFHNVGHGKFQSANDAWRRRPAAEKTYTNFKKHYTSEYKDIQRLLTTGAAGYHHANIAVDTKLAAAATTQLGIQYGTTPPAGANKFEAIIGGDLKMYYCWSHGLGKNATHTSESCNNPHNGHVRHATMKHPEGGSEIMHIGGRRPPRAANNTTSA